jgi:hypothetical protein
LQAAQEVLDDIAAEIAGKSQIDRLAAVEQRMRPPKEIAGLGFAPQTSTVKAQILARRVSLPLSSVLKRRDGPFRRRISVGLGTMRYLNVSSFGAIASAR